MVPEEQDVDADHDSHQGKNVEHEREMSSHGRSVQIMTC